MSISDLREEVLSADFPGYRKVILKEAARFVQEYSCGQTNSQYVQGAMDVVRRIIKIPEMAAKTEEQKEIIRKRIAEDFAVFEVEYLRKALMDE